MSKKEINLFKHTKNDLLSGVVVFLVALPLCLGIALASGASMFSGIISGVIGGIVVGFISKSSLSVSGPAAGLVIIVLTAINDLGFQAFLLALVIAGLIQIFLAYMKAGIIGHYFPSSVIKGMLAAIGIILILKQIPHLVGFDADAFGEMEFFQSDGSNTLSYLISSFEHIYLGSLIVGVVSLIILIIWAMGPVQNNKILKQVPGGLVAVISGVLVNAGFILFFPELAIGSTHLVNLPAISESESLNEIFQFPDWSMISNGKVYITAVTLAIIASLETLLSIEAVDKLDPLKRKTNQNAELKAQGIGNILCGLIGGLPITAVIVRSSANLDAGAKSKMSAVYHGVILLLAVVFIPMVLNMIPLSSLAAILIVVGFKLTKPKVYFHQYGIGKEQFIPFVATVVSILFTDLLIGILIGLAIGFFYILRANYKIPYYYSEEGDGIDNSGLIRIKLSEHVSFLNKANLQLTLENLPDNKNVIVDGTLSKYIDPDALEVIHDFKEVSAERNILCTLKNIPDLDTN